MGLVSRSWLNLPSENSEIGSFPQGVGWVKTKKYMKPPPRYIHLYLVDFIYGKCRSYTLDI